MMISLCGLVTAHQSARHAAINVLPLFFGSDSTISQTPTRRKDHAEVPFRARGADTPPTGTLALSLSLMTDN